MALNTNGAEGTTVGYDLHLSGGVLTANYSRTTTIRTSPQAPTNTDRLDNGQWHHVAFSVDAGGSQLYLDGALVAQATWGGSSGGPPETPQALRIGNDLQGQPIHRLDRRCFDLERGVERGVYFAIHTPRHARHGARAGRLLPDE